MLLSELLPVDKSEPKCWVIVNRITKEVEDAAFTEAEATGHLIIMDQTEPGLWMAVNRTTGEALLVDDVKKKETQDLVERACSCGGDTMHTVTEKDGWDIVQCTACGAVAIEPSIPDFDDEEEDDLGSPRKGLEAHPDLA